MAAKQQHQNNNWTDSLAKIPENVSVTFLPDSSKLSERVLQKGLNYFTQGYIHEIKICEQNDTAVRVEAKCWRSMRKNQQPHVLHIEIQRKEMLESYCSCKAGMNGHCSHIVGLLKSLQGFKLHNFTHVPDQQSCTSIPQQWHIPRGSKIKPVPINDVVVARPLENRKRKPVLCQIYVNYRLPEVTHEDFSLLKKVKGTPLEYIVSEDVTKVVTPLGEVQIGSVLSYQTRDLKIDTEPSSTTGCGNTSVHRQSPINLPEEFKDLNTGYIEEDVTEIEKNTTEQSNSQEWFNHRKNRLTASNFGKVIKRKSVPSSKFLKSIFNNSRSISSAPTDHGKRNEPFAKRKYLEKYKSAHFHSCGFVVNNEFCFLGATPDGKICDNGKSGIVEIKCPFVARNLTIKSACEQIKDFYLEHDRTRDIISLKKTREYFIQVQGQLLITGCDFCEFIVYTAQDIHNERIYPDIQFMQVLLEKLAKFFKDYAKPYLQNQAILNATTSS